MVAWFAFSECPPVRLCAAQHCHPNSLAKYEISAKRLAQSRDIGASAITPHPLQKDNLG